MPYWYWAAFGAVLGVIEVAVPAMVCIWLAAAALAVAAISWRYPGLAWEHQAPAYLAVFDELTGTLRPTDLRRKDAR